MIGFWIRSSLSVLLFLATTSQIDFKKDSNSDLYQLHEIRHALNYQEEETNLQINEVKENIEEEDTGVNVQKLMEERYKNEQRANKQAADYENAQLNALQKLINENDSKLLQALEEAELTKTQKAAIRVELVERYKKRFASKPITGTKVAILGQSSSEFSDTGFNPDVLATLFQLIKAQNPKAVFFTGDLVYNLTSQSNAESSENGQLVDIPPEKNIFGNIVERDTGVYSGQAFKNALERFLVILKENLGTEIPFYPLIGTQESLGADAVEIFRKQFGLNDATVLDSGQLVYTVPIGNALFVVISTDFYANGEPVESSLSQSAWEWLENSVKTEGEKYPFLFVIGSDPAYSTTAPFGIYNGLDKNKEDRDRFWSLLMEHQVLAYFSGKEVLYDRSHRFGVWQVISGGAGTPHDYTSLEDDTFYHYLLLTIPSKQTQDPKVDIFDNKGEKKDEFTLSRKPPLLFEFRISKS